MRLAPPHQRLMLCSMSMARSMMTSAPSSLPLKDPSLFVGRGFIGGEWVGADDGSTVDVTDPASGLCLGSIPNMGGSETRRAVEAAEAAFASWRSKTGKERGAVLRRWFDLIMANQQDLAAIMTAECGKPMAEAVGEIAYGASIVEWCAGDAEPLPTLSPDPSPRRLVCGVVRRGGEARLRRRRPKHDAGHAHPRPQAAGGRRGRSHAVVL